MMEPRLSVIIPTLDEEEMLPAAMASACHEGVEIIVVDGGSSDRTTRIAMENGARLLVQGGGRGTQLQAGANAARAPALLFLHADCRLPVGYLEPVLDALSSEEVAAGAFQLGIDGHDRRLGLISLGANWRSRLLALPYGDQALFVRSATLADIGGIPEQPIMEDYQMVRRLKRAGRIRLLPQRVMTSPRRWKRLGPARTTLINQVMVLGYLLGISPTTLAAWYRGRRRTK